MQTVPVDLSRGAATSPRRTAHTQDPPDIPDWVTEARAKYTLRLRDWLSQAWACTLHPYRFANDWAERRVETLNPLRFFAVGMTVLFLGDRVRGWLFPEAEWTGERFVHSSVTQQLGLVVVAVTMHPVLRLVSRTTFRGTLAALAFSSAGPAALIGALGVLVSLVWRYAAGDVPRVDTVDLVRMPIPMMVGRYLPFLWTFRTLAGVHRVGWWWPVLACFVSFLFFGVVGIVVGIAQRVLTGS